MNRYHLPVFDDLMSGIGLETSSTKKRKRKTKPHAVETYEVSGPVRIELERRKDSPNLCANWITFGEGTATIGCERCASVIIDEAFQTKNRKMRRGLAAIGMKLGDTAPPGHVD